MKKIISLTLCVMLLLSFFAACGKKDSGDDASQTNGLSTADVNFLDEEGDSRYNVIRPEGCSDTVMRAATSVFSVMKKGLELSPKNNDDSEDGEGKYEILIGNTNRPESATAKQMLVDQVGGRKNDYIICTIGTKIVILGATDEATVEAAKYFTSNYLGSTVITGGINYTYKTEGEFKDITIAGNNIQKYSVVRPHYNNSYVVTIEMDKLITYINEVTAYPVQIVEDRYVEPGEYEIVVGDTNRDDVTFSSYDEYSIKVDGNKVYLNGGSFHATAMAVSEFTKMLEKGSVTSADNVEAANYNTALADYDRSKRLVPTWRDEFDGDTIDLTKWNFLGIGQDDANGVDGKTSVRSNDPSISYVRDGKFTIAAAYDDEYWYGGKLCSDNGKTNYLYGFIEISAIIPDGDGFWTTLWMFGENAEGGWLPEIDVHECYGNATKVEGNYHSWPTTLGQSMGFKHYCGLHGGYSIPNTDKDDAHFGMTFHTFGFMWTPEWIGGTVDGNLYQKHDITQDNNYIDTFNDSMYLILSLATYFSSCPVTPNATEWEWENTNKLIVESVYIYQYADGKHKLNGNVIQ